MKYLLMICTDEKDDFAMSRDEIVGLMDEYAQLNEDLETKGAYETSARLRPIGDATTVRVRNGDASITDGPFAETKEQIGGFYMIDVQNLDEAIEWAKRIPSARHGSIEIRPIWEREDYLEA